MPDVIADVLALLRDVATKRTTPKRLGEPHSPTTAVCPACDHTVTARRVVVFTCPCGAIRLEVDFTSNDTFAIALTHHQNKKGDTDAFWLRDGR